MKGRTRCRLHGGKATGRPCVHGLYSKDPARRAAAYRRLAAEIADVLEELDRRGSERVAAEIAKDYAAGGWRRDYALQQVAAWQTRWAWGDDLAVLIRIERRIRRRQRRRTRT